MNEQNPTGISTAPPVTDQDPWLQVTLKLRANLRFETREVGGATVVVIEDSVRGKYFQVGQDEFRVISAIDGLTNVAQIAAALEADGLENASARAVAIGQWLVQSNLAFSDAMDSSSRLEMQRRSMNKSKLIGLMNPISIKTKLFNPNRLLTKITPYCDWFFSRTMLVVWCLIGVRALWTIGTRWQDLTAASVGVLSQDRWLWMLLIWVLLKVIHEAAHGVACKRYGGDVPEAGVLFLLFMPMAYVNVTSMWRSANRWHRVIVAAAGMYVELMISFVAVLVWERTSGAVADIAFQLFLMSSVTTILFNANPLMRFDGYFMLSDLLNIPNLYTKGTKWFGDRLKSMFFGTAKTTGICAANDLRYVACYGSLAFFWKISISLGLVIGASALFQGAGVVLALIGVVLWFGMPIFQQYRLLFGANAKQAINPTRTVVSCVLTSVFVVGMFTFFRAPALKSAPAIVQFRDETVLRTQADGFVREILVRDGEAVTAGQPLIRLGNPQLILAVEQLRHEAEEARIQSRIHQQKQETSLSQAALGTYQSRIEQAAEKQKQADGLVLRAPFDGFVFGRGLANQIDSFAERGTPLLTLAKRDSKELVASVDQRDLESLGCNAGQRLRVVMPGVSVFESTLTKIDPSASDRPTHVSLCAHVSGPLPVKAVSDSSGENDGSSMALLSPRLTAQLEIDPAVGAKLQSGQIGRVFFSTRSQSLGTYLFLAASDWLKTKLDQAAETAMF